MDLVPTKHFFNWLSTTGVAPDARYEEPRCLVYFPYRDFHRFWQIPQRASAVPHFLSALLDGMDDWSACYVWPRGGQWAADWEDSPMTDKVRGVVLAGAGIRPGFDGAARFAAAELDRLGAVAFAYMTFGWMVHDDLFIIPNHARQLLQTDHHDVVHAQFTHAARVAPFVDHMKQSGYALPDEPPDETFKKPDWMQE